MYIGCRPHEVWASEGFFFWEGPSHKLQRLSLSRQIGTALFNISSLKKTRAHTRLSKPCVSLPMQSNLFILLGLLPGTSKDL